jgi:hypothetical protein
VYIVIEAPGGSQTAYLMDCTSTTSH